MDLLDDGPPIVYVIILNINETQTMYDIDECTLDGEIFTIHWCKMVLTISYIHMYTHYIAEILHMPKVKI